MLSFEECEPKRPPRWQKFPLASGTEKFDTTIVHDHHEITYLAGLVLGEFRDRHFEHRENRVRAVEGQHVELTDNRIAQVLRRRSLGPLRSFSRSTICSTPPLFVP